MENQRWVSTPVSLEDWAELLERRNSYRTEFFFIKNLIIDSFWVSGSGYDLA